MNESSFRYTRFSRRIAATGCAASALVVLGSAAALSASGLDAEAGFTRVLDEGARVLQSSIARATGNMASRGEASIDTILGSAKDRLEGMAAAAGTLVDIESFDLAEGRAGWYDAALRLREAIKDDPSLLRRVHRVRISRRREPELAIEIDGDGGVMLALGFAIGPHTYAPRTMDESPYLVRRGNTYALPDSVTVDKIDAPAAEAIRSTLRALPERPRVARFDFDRRFPALLARYGVFLQIGDADDKDRSGSPVYHRILAAWGQEVAQVSDFDQESFHGYIEPIKVRLGNLRYALYRDVNGTRAPVFELRSGGGLGYGLEAYSQWFGGWFLRDVRALKMFAEYGDEGTDYRFPSLAQLDACMGGLWRRQESEGFRYNYRREGWACAQPTF
ncbi:MAG: hypothetical protein HY553_15055 [Elusimicrobia bacterium]|nr:hypothetical protein [Elusimicrobiota bacterium]